MLFSECQELWDRGWTTIDQLGAWWADTSKKDMRRRNNQDEV
jgi:hypothetical protein